jgi:hypothetical protein
LLGVASVSTAQRSNQFRGFWSGTLAPDVLFGVPDAHTERLSQPIDFELRVFTRGRAEVYFTSRSVEWEFTGREFLLTDIGPNGVMLGRLVRGTDDAQSSFSFNLTKIDDETLLLNWSMISIRSVQRHDGLDEIALAGADELRLTDD